MRRSRCRIWIVATGETARARGLYGHGGLARALLAWSAYCAGEDAAGVEVLSDLPELLETAASLGLASRRTSAGSGFSEALAGGAGGLFLAPHRGLLCRDRVRKVREAARAYPGRKIVSARRVPPNSHPAWLSSVPGGVEEGGAVVVADFKADHRVRLSAEARRQLGLAEGGIKGSQWLPELYARDEAVVLLPESPAGPPLPVCDAPGGYAGLPLFYRLPLWEMSPDFAPCFDWSRMRPEFLFRTPDRPGEEGDAEGGKELRPGQALPCSMEGEE